MLDLLRKALAAGQADYLEVRIQTGSTTTVNYTGRELETIGRHTTLGGSVRAMVQGGWAMASLNQLEDLPRLVKATCDQARQVQRKSPGLASVPPARARVPATPAVDPRLIPLEQKERLCAKYNNILLSAPHIQTSNVVYRDSAVTDHLLTSDGTELVQEICLSGLLLMAIAKDGCNVQRAYESVGDLRGYQVVEGLEEACEAVAREAADLLAAAQPDAGPHTVVIDPKLCGVFVHEAFGHLSEADHLCENERLQDLMTIGRRFGPDSLTICDNPEMPGEAGSYVYDSEGTPGTKTHLIRDGILASRLHSRETAALMHEPPTGNARCLNYEFAPIVRMSNTYMEPRDATFDDLLRGIKRGIYAIGSMGGQTDMEMFTFAAERGFEIRDGKIGRKLRDIVLTGNVFHTLANIEAIGGDFHMHGGLGGCGKGGQSPLRVSDGGPSVRIKDVVIGGRG